jgi:hypothetical protein
MASIVDASNGKEAEEVDEERVGKKSEILWSQIVEWKYAVFRIIYSHIPHNKCTVTIHTSTQSNAVPSIRTPILVFTSIPSNFIFPACELTTNQR